MKHDIDLFGEDFPSDRRFKTERIGRLLNIVFHGGTFGNFLRYFLDKFSKSTPEIDEEPFTDIGTGHSTSKIRFSGMIQRYHQNFIIDNEASTNLPVCLITPSTRKHYLYLKKAQWYRPRDSKISPDDLWNKPFNEIEDHAGRKNIDTIMKLYDMKDVTDLSLIPKFIIRDWYKLEFLQELPDTYNYQWFDKYKRHPFFEKQKVFHLDLETFFNWDHFMRNITILNDIFAIELDFRRKAEMKEIFDKGLSLDAIRLECNLVEDVLTNWTDADLDQLDVSSEAFIYSELERANPNILLPLSNNFFKNTKEIKQFIDHFPNWYRRPNPNLG